MAWEDPFVEDQGDGDNQTPERRADPESRSSEEEDQEEDEDEEDDEPRLKYASLTKGQGPLYRNGDAASAFLVAGDKMIIGTHNGNIHVLLLPSFHSLRVYHAHSASITAVSISPFPPPLPIAKPDAVSRLAAEQEPASRSSAPQVGGLPSAKSPKPQAPVPATPANSIHIATSSIDGNVCVYSLVDPKDVMLRNFGRPVQAVALSPEYKNDRTYVSGGLAGNLVMTVGGRAGKSATSNTVGGAAATASGWLGTIGLGANNGVDTVLHSGEGSISTIKWSLSGKYVVWVNEHGIKIMRSNLYLDAAESEFAWKRMSHIDRPNRPGWEEMAGVWKARAEWVDETGLEEDDDENDAKKMAAKAFESQPPKLAYRVGKKEKLLLGWGGTIWIIDVHPGGSGTGKDVGERKIGHVEIVTILRIDCIISGISLYTPNLLLVLAYVSPDKDGDQESLPSQGTPKRGVHRRKNALEPEMKIIDILTKEEVCVADTLHVSRFEGLSATDYHLGVLPVMKAPTQSVVHRGALEVIGGGIWDAALYANPNRLFSSTASVRSAGSVNVKTQASTRGSSDTTSDANGTTYKAGQDPHPALLTRGMKIFIQSPYDCVLATKPTIADHLIWLDTHERYEEAWKLLGTHPEAARISIDDPSESGVSTPTKQVTGSLEDFFGSGISQTPTSTNHNFNSQTEKEKRRIGEKWLQQLVKAQEWTRAGQITAQVIGTSSSWEHWIWVFAEANKFEEITPFIPTTQLHPPISPTVYEMILGHYISKDRERLKELLYTWPPELYDVSSIITAVEGKLKVGEFQEDTVKDGEVGQDWRILTDSLAKLYIADGRARDALKCYIGLQDADAAMFLISEHHLVEALSDDIAGLILLRVTKEQQNTAPLSELEETSREAIQLLVSEALQGIVRPDSVITQLQAREGMLPYLFFYLGALWNGEALEKSTIAPKYSSSADHLASEGRSLVNDHADTAVSLFAEYDRDLFFAFLRGSQSYTLSTASTICEQRQYIPELVYLLAKEGRTKRALSVILEKLDDVSQAIAFAKEQDDDDLWNDLLDYSMNKPSFIRALLEEVGTTIDPVTLVRRIPEGLEIEGLRESLSRMIREYELQDSISEGVAKVLRGEVATGMATLRTGQKKGVKFDVVPWDQLRAQPVKKRLDKVKPGRCFGCGLVFVEDEKQTIIGFPCTHIFHLSCLLTYDAQEDTSMENDVLPSDTQIDSSPPLLKDVGIGPKVRHAKELRGKVGTGCPVLVHKEEK